MTAIAEGERRAVENMHGGTATLAQSVPVRETFDGATVWEGVVHIFDLVGYPKATRAYAWSSPIEGSTKRRFFAVLHTERINGGSAGGDRGRAQRAAMKTSKYSDAEKLVRDLDTLAQSAREDWADLSTKRLSGDDRRDIRQHLEWCLTEMQRLLKRLDG
jgi:hypothetical protein